MSNQPVVPIPSPEDVFTGVLKNFHAETIRELWAKALARRVDDPANAITLARTLLESVCKYILDGSNVNYSHGLPLPELYKLTAKALSIAPTATTEPIFATLFNACVEIVKGVGQLRNFMSDSHGHGKAVSAPDWRHAELAINLAGTMATYLFAVWQNRQPTVAALIANFLEAPPRAIGKSQRFTLGRLREPPIGAKIAAWLTTDDLLEHCRALVANGLSPQTVKQYVGYLRGVIKSAKLSDDVFRQVAPMLAAEGLVGQSQERLRRPKPAELERALSFFREIERGLRPRRGKPREIPMTTIIEFAAASGRRLNEITRLRWDDLNSNKRTCLIGKEEFKLADRAWDIVMAQPKTEARIFPHVHGSISAGFTRAMKEVGIPDLIFNDLRLEAICRLLEGGYGIHEVAYITGQKDHNYLARVKHTLIDLPRNQ